MNIHPILQSISNSISSNKNILSSDSVKDYTTSELKEAICSCKLSSILGTDIEPAWRAAKFEITNRAIIPRKR